MKINTPESRVVAVIPARYASSRFPGKPLALLAGQPMFWHVYQRAKQCASLEQVWLATDDERIQAVARDLHVPCLMTSTDLPSGTDRVWQAAQMLGLAENSIVVNIQGDEPLLHPDMLELLVRPLLGVAEPLASTLAFELNPFDPGDQALLHSPDQVKVVCAANGQALYFSRLPVPYCRDNDYAVNYKGHLGFYAYTYAFLAQAAALLPSPLELAEKLEQLRWLENGLPLKVLLSSRRSCGVDMPEDLLRAEQLLASGLYGPDLI